MPPAADGFYAMPPMPLRRHYVMPFSLFSPPPAAAILPRAISIALPAAEPPLIFIITPPFRLLCRH